MDALHRLFFMARVRVIGTLAGGAEVVGAFMFITDSFLPSSFLFL
jgi:hypothetical protein